MGQFPSNGFTDRSRAVRDYYPKNSGWCGWDRTSDLVVKSHLLLPLSYAPKTNWLRMLGSNQPNQ